MKQILNENTKVAEESPSEAEMTDSVNNIFATVATNSNVNLGGVELSNQFYSAVN